MLMPALHTTGRSNLRIQFVGPWSQKTAWNWENKKAAFIIDYEMVEIVKNHAKYI